MSDYGWIWFDGRKKPFKQWRMARAHKGIERVAVTLKLPESGGINGGYAEKEVLMPKSAVSQWPENAKEEAKNE